MAAQEPPRTEKTVDFSSNRKWRNFLLAPLLQLTLGAYMIAAAALMIIALLAVTYVKMNDFAEIILQLTDVEAEVTSMLRDELYNLTGWIVSVVFAYITVSLMISITYTHRMIGPIYAFRRQVQNMMRGKYHRVTIRRNDAFGELAGELNLLAKMLEEGTPRTEAPPGDQT